MAQEEKLYNTILSKELTWEGLIRDIVTNEGLNPWDINISKLTNKYMKSIKKMKELDIRISGKFILAAAILLKMKSDYLILKEKEEVEEKQETIIEYRKDDYEIQPNIPQPKERKVTINELINSLQKALVVKKRRKVKKEAQKVDVKLDLKKVDLGEKVSELYKKIVNFFQRFKKKSLTFSKLTPSEEREDIIWTIIPLMHLANQGKIEVDQKEQFGEIYVRK